MSFGTLPRLSGRMTGDDHPRARAGSSKGAARPPPEPNPPIECDVRALGRADVRALEALALLQLAARRRGLRVVLRGASGDLRDLLALAGLDDALPCEERSGFEPRRQPEQREEAFGVEEEADPRDLPARYLDDL
jgi:ABC-type transporter Mla MlaB component